MKVYYKLKNVLQTIKTGFPTSESPFVMLCMMREHKGISPRMLKTRNVLLMMFFELL
ncbi:MAG: hypothetical protein Q4A09_04865 [Capnocytophaga felis]|nr:hypothetical protein [Capnocytophaga felis]